MTIALFVALFKNDANKVLHWMKIRDETKNQYEVTMCITIRAYNQYRRLKANKNTAINRAGN